MSKKKIIYIGSSLQSPLQVSEIMNELYANGELVLPNISREKIVEQLISDYMNNTHLISDEEAFERHLIRKWCR